MRAADLSPDRRARLIPVPEHSGALALCPPPVDLSLVPPLPSLVRAQEALVRLQVETEHLPNPDLVTRTLARREAVLSSQIEGTHAGIRDVLDYEATHDATDLPADARSTLDYAKALDYGLQEIRTRGIDAFSSEFICKLHCILMEGDPSYRDTPGRYRTIQNWIGGFNIHDARLVPPPPDRVPEAMDNLVDSLLRYEPESNAHYHAIVRAAVAHAQFEAIHPFRDGNGRTGRLLIPLILAADGYLPLYVSGPLHRNRGRYFDTLLATQLRSEWAGWIDFFNEAVEIGCDESMRTARGLIGLRDDWRVRLQDLRADAAALRVIDLLIASPVVTVNQVKAALNVSFPAANNAVLELVDRGILTGSERRRNRTFRANDAINILNAAPSQPGRPASDMGF